jgi:hypothetical protein
MSDAAILQLSLLDKTHVHSCCRAVINRCEVLRVSSRELFSSKDELRGKKRKENAPQLLVYPTYFINSRLSLPFINIHIFLPFLLRTDCMAEMVRGSKAGRDCEHPTALI